MGLEDPRSGELPPVLPNLAYLGGRTGPTAGGGYNEPTQSIKASGLLRHDSDPSGA